MGKSPYMRVGGGKQSPEPTHLFHLPALEIVKNSDNGKKSSNPGTILAKKKKKTKVQMQETSIVSGRISLQNKLKEKDAIPAMINF